MGPAVGVPVVKRGRTSNVSSELQERKTVEKVNGSIHLLSGTSYCDIHDVVPGGERLVKDLRDRFLQGKFPLMLSKVNDVHVLCGFLKDFLRKLKEPLITFRLHRTFMEVSGRLFQPLTSPELNSYYKTTSRVSVRGRIRNLGNALTNTGRVEPGRKFFTSPS
ncbi:hypothetical protein F2P81_022873 [Scophthalmus maximus]|uniref:Rho-GAP domain-containing protein n=1 Tax=Scophthalmus maximus TaxID=52904 RepID=A0A6A4S3T6_SCOMX|nr:hypothetical protein F2P81_022873 [Scophthalmus maximus]